jgi:hypothetical protein
MYLDEYSDSCQPKHLQLHVLYPVRARDFSHIFANVL